VPLAAAIGVLMRFALQQYYASRYMLLPMPPPRPCGTWVHEYLRPSPEQRDELAPPQGQV